MNRTRNWIFVYNQEEGTPLPTLQVSPNDNVKYMVYQHEKVETDHLQGMIIFNNPRRFNGVRKFFKKLVGNERTHIEPMQGSVRQAYEYCTKDESRVEPPIEYGDKPDMKPGNRNDLHHLTRSIDKCTMEEIYYNYPSLAARYPKYIDKLYSFKLKRQAKEQYVNFIKPGPFDLPEETKQVKVYYGAPGSGKTSRVFIKHPLDDIYTLTFGDGSSNSLWFDDYQGESILLLDDFYGQIKYSLLLRILDIYPLRVQQKGSYTHVNFKKIYITSNEHPSQWYTNVDNTSALERRITKTKEVRRH